MHSWRTHHQHRPCGYDLMVAHHVRRHNRVNIRIGKPTCYTVNNHCEVTSQVRWRLRNTTTAWTGFNNTIGNLCDQCSIVVCEHCILIIERSKHKRLAQEAARVQNRCHATRSGCHWIRKLLVDNTRWQSCWSRDTSKSHQPGVGIL